MSFALDRYRVARVETATPVQLVVDLYRGATRFLRQAIVHDREGQPAARGVALGKAHAIVSELQATLNRDRAPELVDQLDRLYDFVLHRITEANVRADVTLLEAALDVLATLESAWSQLAARAS
ncbi:MAG: flagellar export chaperone FliS [Sandaracinaceae bacterium]